MHTLFPVTDSVLSVRDAEGMPTGVMVFTPVVEIEGHTIATGAMKDSEGGKVYGVVVDGQMAENPRSDKPLSPNGLEIKRDGRMGAISFQNAPVMTIKFA